VAAEKDSTHAPRTAGRVCDARVVFRVFHDNQAARAVQQQLGVEAQLMWLSRREWDHVFAVGHNVMHSHVHGCCL
jgi:hypothetical protein